MTAPALDTQLILRPIRGAAELPAMAALAARCNEVDQVEDRPTTEELTAWFEHLVNTDPAEDILLAEVDGRLVGYQYTAWRCEADGAYRYMLFGFLHPDWRRRGVGTALLRRGEARLRAVASFHPAEAAKYFQTYTADTRAGKVALFHNHGYAAVRHFFYMRRDLLADLPPAPLPAGLALRPVDKTNRAQLHAIWEASEEAFRDHWGTVEASDEDFERLLADPNTNPDLWQVAWDTASGQIAGVSLNAIRAGDNAAAGLARGWVEDLSVRRPYRQRGLGRALLVTSLHALRAHGCTEAALGVDVDNPSGALGLYESAGFVSYQHHLALRKAL